MKRFFVFLGLALSMEMVCAQNIYKDINPDRVSISNSEGSIKFHVMETGEKVRAKKGKEYFWYSGGKIMQTYGGFSGKLLNGAFASFYPGKPLKEQGEFKGGLKQGNWKSWDESGDLQAIHHWSAGIKDGAFEEYNDSNQLMRKGYYRNGLLHGKVRIFHGRDSVQVKSFRKGAEIPPKVSDGKDGFFRRLRKNVVNLLNFEKKGEAAESEGNTRKKNSRRE